MNRPAAPTPTPSLVRSTRTWLGVILAGHLLLALLYSLAIPPWEAHDEWAHFRYAATIAETHALPDPGQRLTHEFEFDEASQPPLYYLLAALPMLAVDTQDGYSPQVNPYISGEKAQTGHNMAVHDPKIEAFPWRGTILALHLGRFVSIGISLLALLITFSILRYLSPTRPHVALIGTALQAFAPQFIFISAVITNDILVIVLEPLLLYYSLRLIEEGPRPRLTFYTALVAGLALLTKYLALAVIPLALIAFAWGAWRHRHLPDSRRRWLQSLLIFLGMLLITSGGLLWRNYQFTGVWIPRDPVSQNSLITGLQSGQLAIDWQLLPQALSEGFETYWASFGWGNVAPDAWVYAGWLLVILVGLGGWLWWLRSQQAARARRLTPFLLIFLFAAISFPLLRELIHGSPHLRGRYMLATLPIAVWIIAQGWDALLPGKRLTWALLAWPLALSLYLLPGLLLPAYAAPRPLTEPPTPAIPLHARFDDVAELIGADLWPPDEVHARQGLAVTLTWRVLARSDQPYTLSIQLVGAGDQPYGSVLTYPGHGNAATNIWQPGVFQETYWLDVRPERPLPTSGQVQVVLFNSEADPAYLPIYDSQGQRAGDNVRFGSVRISPEAAQPAPPIIENPLAFFDQRLALQKARLEETPQQPGGIFPVWLRWQALGPGEDDLTLSLQLLDQNNTWMAGNDGPVDELLLPPHWRRGDHLDTVRWFSLPPDLPPGRYTLVVTIYHAQTLARLTATDPQGQPLPDNAYALGSIIVQ